MPVLGVHDGCFFGTEAKKLGIETTYFDPLIGEGISKLIKKNTKVIFMESPASLTFEIQDVPLMFRDLYIIKFKILYKEHRHEKCESCVADYLGKLGKNMFRNYADGRCSFLILVMTQ